jgi:hypothetical protein
VVLAEYLTFSSDPQGFDLCSPAVSDGYVFAMLDGGGLYAFFGGGGVPPVGALVINGGDGCTASRNVTLTLDNNDNPNVTQMRISEDPFFTGVPWVSYQGTTLFTLSAGYGLKTVYAQLRDNAGQVSVVFTDQIAYQAVCGEPNVVATASSLSVESCTPANGVADPGERVTYALTLSNIGTAPTTNLVATLIAGANVSAPSAPQSYGVIPPGGNATRTFSWTGVGTSGQPWTAIVRLADGTLTFPNATITGTYGSSLGCATVRLVTRTVLSRVGANVQAVITVTNTGSTTANSVALTRALLGATAGAPLPQSLGNIPAGGSASATVAFPNVVAGTSTLSIGGTYTGGTFTSKVRVRVP